MTHTHRTYKAAVLQVGANKVLRLEVVKTLEKFGLTPHDWTILGHIFHNESVRFVDLAQLLGVEPPHVTTLVDSLEKKDLVARKDDPKDRRAKRIILTKKSEELVPEVEIELSARMNLLLEGITTDEMVTYFKILETIIGNGSKLMEPASIPTPLTSESSKSLDSNN